MIFFNFRVADVNSAYGHNSFEFGMNADVISSLGNTPPITPISGGFWNIEHKSGYDIGSEALGDKQLGTSLYATGSQFWKFQRIYYINNQEASLGGWPVDMFHKDDFIYGVCFGTI